MAYIYERFNVCVLQFGLRSSGRIYGAVDCCVWYSFDVYGLFQKCTTLSFVISG